MTDFNSPGATPPLFTGPLSGVCAYDIRSGSGGAAPGNNAWGTANRAIYLPFWTQTYYPVNRVWWVNGTPAGNVDFGIYSTSGARIYSTGSTAGSGASAPQYVTPGTPFLLAPGAYYIALASDSTTATFLSINFGAGRGRVIGALEQLSAFALPASATFVTVTATFMPYIGITRTTTGF